MHQPARGILKACNSGEEDKSKIGTMAVLCPVRAAISQGRRPELIWPESGHEIEAQEMEATPTLNWIEGGGKKKKETKS